MFRTLSRDRRQSFISRCSPFFYNCVFPREEVTCMCACMRVRVCRRATMDVQNVRPLCERIKAVSCLHRVRQVTNLAASTRVSHT